MAAHGQRAGQIAVADELRALILECCMTENMIRVG
jgi:hypothetical protein